MKSGQLPLQSSSALAQVLACAEEARALFRSMGDKHGSQRLACDLWHVVACCGMLWHVVACCGMLWHVVACCGMLWHASKKRNRGRSMTQHCVSNSFSGKLLGSREVGFAAPFRQMDLASAFIVPAPCAGAWQPARHAHPVAPSAKRAASFDGSRSSLCLALLAARVVKSSRAYFSGNRLSPAELAERTERKREMETNRFFANQRSLLKVGGRRPLSDAQWARDEKLLFGSSHVVAGINFSKYDDIKVVAEGGTGKEKPIASFQEACDRYQLPDELTENLTRCSYSTPTPVQKYSIPAVLEGNLAGKRLRLLLLVV